MKRYVITHPDYGIYLGRYIGLGFWSMLNSLGRDSAVVFESSKDAWVHINTWCPQNAEYRKQLVISRVDCEHPEYARIPELRAAGLDIYLSDMETSALRYTKPAGRA